MREWIDEISNYMQEKEALPLPHVDLSEEIHQAALETDMLIEATQELQSAINTIAGKIALANF